MYSVNYHRVTSLAEAVSALGMGDAKLLSGGMTLIPAMKTRLAAPSDLVDISRIGELAGIRVEGRTLTIGAATTHHDVATSDVVANACPALADLAAHIGDPHVRYMGTIGGSVANNDPAADYPAALLALNATVVTNKREHAAADFFTGLFETALEEDEIVTAVKFQLCDQAGYEKFRNPASRYAMTGVFVARDDAGVRVAVTGAGENGVFRSTEIEAALGGNFDPSAVANVSLSADGMMGDIHASPEYRANLVVVMAKRAVAKALR
ncbi:carbon monoxide dehydrogenase [Mesorhizobium sp. NBSH29]|uniref:FAD binding domain-containing protein n=1 Tax=Mesorhizobium sp. NBSH29 TaxID=2654249 RepID=UPI0018965A27|nr:xanthine dehydrogenase family protein subunit M [Mesorhizobium sp. NBSH29]QPC87496.1 carbon monoxide dehydrogenase [Mesorhizobium sp. NBSH29]